MEVGKNPVIGINVASKKTIIKCLQNSSALINKVSSKRNLNILRYTWYVGSYSELETGVTYENFVEKAYYSCIFQLEKTDKDLISCVVIGGSLVENAYVQVYIKILNKTPPYSEDFATSNPLNSEIKHAVEETKGKFILKFPFSTLEIGNARQNVSLYVVYQFVIQSREKPLTFWIGNIGKKSAAEVSEHISFEKNSSLFSDFTIIARKRVFPVHKCILAVRSRYFLEYFKCQGLMTRMEVDAFPGIVWYVLRYLYGGEIDVLDVNTMMQIFYLAGKWKIFSLMEICSYYLRGNMELDDMNKETEFELDAACFGLSDVTKKLEKLQLDERIK